MLDTTTFIFDIIGSVINLLVAGGTIAAVIVALNGIQTTRKQYQEQIRLQNRPILVPTSSFSHHGTDGGFDWSNTNDISLTLQNMGSGVALEIYSIICSPEGDETYSSLSNIPIDGKSSLDTIYTKLGNFNVMAMTVDGEYALYPELTSDEKKVREGNEYKIARLTTTYHDILGYKYVSIFDYVRPLKARPAIHGWSSVAVKQILTDLYELSNETMVDIISDDETMENSLSDQDLV